MRPYCREWGVGWAEDGSVELAAGAYWASYEGSLPMLQYMVETVGCELAVANAVGVSPLMYAARQGFDSICTYILDALEKSDGRDAMLAHLDLKTTAGLDLCAIDGAATRGHASTVKLLAARGADFMARRANGRAPLHSAAAFCHASFVRALLELGADPKAKADDGSLPVDLVTMSCSVSAWPSTQHDEVIQLLNEAVVKQEGARE